MNSALQKLRAPLFVVELLKGTRSEWMTVYDICEATDADRRYVSKWVTELQANGILKAREGKPTGRPGKPPEEFHLSSSCGGL